jgi:PAS domain S-box-containing protein
MSLDDDPARVAEDPLADPDELVALLRILEGTATQVGDTFLPTLVSHLAELMGVGYAFVAEFAGAGRARTLAYCKGRDLQPTAEWDLAGTPCEDVVAGQLCHHPKGVSRKFPGDRAMVELGIESYLGVPLAAPDGQHLGHLCVFDTRPMPPEPRKLAIFRVFAARAAAELGRLRLERTLGESEERFRDLFDEAPIAYVHEGLDSHFIRANRAAMRTLGITPEEVPTTVGRNFVPDTPDAQRRLREAFESIGRGTDTSGVVLELRRKDDGRPLWIQWWSKPDPSGAYTRTMFVDITERVLLEQEQARLREQNTYLREEINTVHNFEEIVGRSSGLLRVLADVERVAPTEASVLITGETGTGKELIARAIHSTGARRARPLIKLNCAALPTSLVESELFGHEKGAFSGALARRIGRFELAHGGTIFLDEIGDVPLEMQVKLLRVLQEREFERVGGNTPLKADVRVIAATNRDLHKAMREGRFREDLFYRLNVFPIQLPALRERANDIPLLVMFFLAKFTARIGKRIDAVSPEAMARFQAYPWPGNIRELENVIERAVILSSGPELDVIPGLLPSSAVSRVETVTPSGGSVRATLPSSRDAAPSSDAPSSRVAGAERDRILAALRATEWRIDGEHGAAAQLGLNPSTLRSRIKKLGISRSHEAR